MAPQLTAPTSTDSAASPLLLARDRVNVWNQSSQIALYKGIYPSKFPPSILIGRIPGNHDIDSAGSSVPHALAQLAHFKETFGTPDYSTLRTKTAAFVMLNSEFLILPFLGLNGTTDRRILEPVAAQWAWADWQVRCEQPLILIDGML